MKRLRDIRCFMLDMDGTFYLGHRLLPGALRFMDYLAQTGREAVFVTNNSSNSAAYYAEKLTKLGWRANPEDILTAGQATAYYLLAKQEQVKVFLVGTPALAAEMTALGVTLTDREPDYVVLGFDMTLTYDKLVQACRFLRAGVPFVATHPDINCPTEDGYIPDCGAMTALLSASTGVAPKVIGKPNAEMIEALLLKKPSMPRTALAMVGDRLYTDIATGKNAGIASILVLSGETQEQDLPGSAVQPDLIFANLGALQETLEEADAL